MEFCNSFVLYICHIISSLRTSPGPQFEDAPIFLRDTKESNASMDVTDGMFYEEDSAEDSVSSIIMLENCIPGCLPSQGSQGKVREYTLSLEKSGKRHGI